MYVLQIGNQIWFCQENGEFKTEIPDRRNCIEEWIEELDKQIDDPNINSTNISEAIKDNLKNEEDLELSEQGLDKLAWELTRLLMKRKDELDNCSVTDHLDFFQSYLTNHDLMLNFNWSNIMDLAIGYNSTNNILENIFHAGDIYEESISDDFFADDGNYTGNNFYSRPLITFEMDNNTQIVHENVTITIPKGQNAESASVTFYQIKDLTNKFPKNLEDDIEELNLLQSMVDFTFYDDIELEGKIQIQFVHDDIQKVPNGYFGQVTLLTILRKINFAYC